MRSVTKWRTAFRACLPLHLALSLTVSTICLTSFEAGANDSAYEKTAAESTNDCPVAYENENLRVEYCQVTPLSDAARLFIKRGSQAPTFINALYTHDRGSSEADQFWDQLWISSGPQRLSTEDQARLQQIISTEPQELSSIGVLPLLNVLANMVEPGVKIESFDGFVENKSAQWGFSFRRPWTMICEFYKQPKDANFTANGILNRIVTIVGENKCNGRCGWGCFSPMRATQYTQECLDHDVCRETIGSQFGQCADEFWRASASYTFAPNCF